MASFIAAGTSYATRGVPMVPFYTFYSMFGFQRVGDLIWQAADSRTRGFLLGATAGRTTLIGEGLQHQDGHSLVLATTVPACQAYDPAFAYEVAAIVQARPAADVRPDARQRRDRRLLLPHAVQRELPDAGRARRDRHRRRDHARPVQVAGRAGGRRARRRCCSRGSAHGAVAPGRRRARRRTTTSAPSCGRRRRTRRCARTRSPSSAGTACTRTATSATPLVAELLADAPGPIVAVTDFMKIVPEQIARFAARPQFMPLGTDGMGRSDTREALRHHFEIDAGHVVVAMLAALAKEGAIEPGVVKDAIGELRHRPRSHRPLHRLTEHALEH